MSEASTVERFNDFLVWERGTRDTIDLKKIYIDMAGDLKAGVMLSQIIYWYLPSKGRSEGKLTIHRGDNWWIVKKRHEWWEETRLSPREVDRALEVLVEKKLVITERHQFGKTLSTYIRINKEVFLPYLNHILHNPLTNPYCESNSPKSELVEDTNSPTGELPHPTNSPTGEFYNTETTITEITSAPANAGAPRTAKVKRSGTIPWPVPEITQKFVAGETVKQVKPAKERTKDLIFESVLSYAYGITYVPGVKVPDRTAGHVRAIVKELKDGGVDSQDFVDFCKGYKTWAAGLNFPLAPAAMLASFNRWKQERASTAGSITIKRLGDE